jgi:hypothetical protein
MSDVFTTQDVKPQCVLLRFWHFNQAILILKSPIACARQKGKAHLISRVSAEYFVKGRGSMMRPTINEESDCLRKKNLRRRAENPLPISGIKISRIQIHIILKVFNQILWFFHPPTWKLFYFETCLVLWCYYRKIMTNVSDNKHRV